MDMKIKIKITLFLLLTTIINSCTINKELLTEIQKKELKHIDFPIYYYQHLPDSNITNWNNDYDAYNKFVTKKVAKTQLGISYRKDSILYWQIYPSARPHVQLDSATMILDKNKLYGNWRAVSIRTILFSDSINIKSDTLIRTYKVLNTDTVSDIVTTFTEYGKMKVYYKKGNNYYLKLNRNFEIENGRYLMLYKINPLASAISIIGITKDNYLIIGTYLVAERSKRAKYYVYETTMQQTIFKRIEEY